MSNNNIVYSMQQRNIHFRASPPPTSYFNLPKHQKTTSRTLITYDNIMPISTNSNIVQNNSFNPHYPSYKDPSYHKVDDLAFTKASTLQLQIIQDNAYLKSSIRYFQKENQRLLRQIEEKDKRIGNVKDQLNQLLIKENQSLVSQNRSFEKALHSRSKNRFEYLHGDGKYNKSDNKRFIYGNNNSDEDNRSNNNSQNKNKSIDYKLKYLKSLKSIKVKLDGISLEDHSREKERDHSQSFRSKRF